MKTVSDFITCMESTDILKSGNKYTFSEYSEELLRFQSLICKLIANGEFRDDMRIDEAMFILESNARQKGLHDHAAIHTAIQTMKTLSKELAVTMSGIHGEKLVSKTLNYLNRPNTRVFKNVYVTNGVDEETELDFIVLIDSAILLLEVKKVKEDLTITADGRMVVGDECFGGKSTLGEKMIMKRRLLKEAIEKAAADRGVEFPTLYVDSLIVFCAPYGEFIHVEDLYRKERFCFHTAVNKKLENYVGCAYYKPSHMDELAEILANLEANTKRYPTDLDFDKIRFALADAIALLKEDEPEAEQEAAPAVSIETPAPTNTPEPEKVLKLDKHHLEVARQKKRRNKTLAASIVAGVLISTIAATIAHHS